MPRTKKQSKLTIEKRKQTFLEKKKNGYIQTNENHRKKVICVETNEIFDSLADATRKYSKTNTANISNCCKGKRNYCGTLEDGRKMHWKYYEDYIKELESTAS